MTMGDSLPLALRAWGWMARVEWRRRKVPFDDLVAWLEGIPPNRRSAITTDAAFRAARCACAWSPFGNSCLKIALVALALLRRGGYSARLAIGVRDAAVPVEGHAWIEVDGSPLDSLASDST